MYWPKRRYDVVSVVVSIGDKSRTVNAIVIDRLPEGIYTEGLRNTIKYLRNQGLKMADADLREAPLFKLHVGNNTIENVCNISSEDYSS